jgi:septal ring factor EnvC (AmiA/AmiB activator)
MELNEQLIEAIVMSATAGQFGTQIVEETFKLSIDALTAAKKQLFLHLCSGLVALTVYIFTNESFVLKAGLLAFLSGMFAEAALKMLKKKNQKEDKTVELAIKLEKKEREELEEELKSLREEVKKLQEPKDVQA